MRALRLRTKVLLLLAALLLLALAATLGVVQWNLQHDISTRVLGQLKRAQTSLASREEQRYQLLGTLAHTLEVNPSLRLIMNRTDRPTLESFLTDIKTESGVDLVLLTDLQGQNIASFGYPEESATQWESVQLSLEGEDAVDHWLISGKLYQVYTVPLTAGGLVDGTVSMGLLLNDGVLRSAAGETGVEISLIHEQKLLAKSFDFGKLPRYDRQESHTLNLGGRHFRHHSVFLEGSSPAELLLLNDISPSEALLKETRNQLLFIGGLTFLLALAFSWPLVGRVTVSSQLLETVVETVGEGLCQLDQDGVILMVNPEGEKLLGLTEEEVLGKPFLEVVQVEPELPRLDQALRLDDVTVHTRKTDFPASVVATPFEADGQSGTVLIIRDISHIKKTEKALRQAARVKADFLAHMSHEIRTPMNGVLGMNSLLLKTPLSKTQSRYAQTIDSSGRALLEIINDVLDHSKLEAGAVRLESVPFDLWQTVEDVASLLALRAYEKKVELVLSIHPETPTQITGDPSRLRQVLINLAGNAIKFTNEGSVLVSVRPTEQKVRFKVEDTGIGIARDVQRSLFQDFTQAESRTTRLFGGTGLGLSISDRLVKLMGGKIQLKSEPNEGSEFWFDLDQVEPVWKKPDELGPARVAIFVRQAQRQEYLKSLLAHWGLEIHDDAEVKIVEPALLDRSADPARTVVLTQPGQDFAETHCCPVPLQTENLYSILKAALQGESPEKSLAASSESNQTLSPDAPLVLVVDDNETNREVAEASLTQLGYRSLSVESGQLALQALESEDVDGFLMDCEMPEMDGYETSQKIRETHPELPIIALTAGIKAENRERVFACGMNALLLKPFRLEEMRQTLADCGLSIPKQDEEKTADSGAQESSSEVVLNHSTLEFLRTLREDDPNFVPGLIQGYLASFDQVLNDFKSARKTSDWEQIAVMAHKQRGAAGNLGLEKLRAACQSLEENPEMVFFDSFLEAASEARRALEEHLEDSSQNPDNSTK